MVRGRVIGKVIWVSHWGPTAMTNGNVPSSKECCTPCLAPGGQHGMCKLLCRKCPVFSQQGTGKALSHDCWRPSSPLSPNTSRELSIHELAVCCKFWTTFPLLLTLPFFSLFFSFWFLSLTSDLTYRITFPSMTQGLSTILFLYPSCAHSLH